ncbi:MAG TPA: zinc ribbon domain-containing protein [Candidatus Ornithomonoglobus merdipullorum]|uniref:Zinc ribbon domain-containing protein n=1 Tax=Candidatus Ornithomonoglobus merdipullorum TaxID=2840895 RepID=A0A9D1SFL9_9FIRM|nr:zinc ribbon domain-containing protein [Candidatus Ornithomonoglobus merdipullorum]
MKCDKCGAVLEDDAVFCYKCGSFVMSDEDTEPIAAEKAGKRRRGSSSFPIVLRILIWAAVAAAGVAAAVFGYRWIYSDELHMQTGESAAVYEVSESEITPVTGEAGAAR